jgi:hypothetical protein
MKDATAPPKAGSLGDTGVPLPDFQVIDRKLFSLDGARQVLERTRPTRFPVEIIKGKLQANEGTSFPPKVRAAFRLATVTA